ncbi:MAG: hypothetical protein P8I80_00860 [Bacteroidales bacterium]|jgi:hypothetical protein|nr:hypothetical protein [Bacteroidales bacterium]MDG2080782.1 hypothetical protein [Bacteroidales bacterium]|tara:strand:+ start:3647 stop:4387 length:741 start_codon:yes stop_codon:yes gene_type:complete
MKKITILLLVMGLAIMSQAQIMFDKGVSGFSINAGIQESYWEDGFYGGLQYTFKGALDISAEYGNFTYDRDKLEAALGNGAKFTDVPKESVLAFSAQYWVLRTDPGSDRGINVGVWAGYEMENYTDTEWSQTPLVPGTENVTTDKTGSAFAFGTSFSIDFDVKDGWRLQPYSWIGRVFATEKGTYDGVDETENYQGTGAGIGVILQKMLNNGSSVWFGAEWDMDNLENANDTSYEVTVGFNLGFAK